MRVLIVGGTGFIGPYVAKELVERGHEVTVFHRGQHESVLLPDVRHFRSELAARPVLGFPDDLLCESFEIVIHMIAMGEADARAALRAFAGRASRLVVLSSGDVYRAYGRFTGLEQGAVEEDPLHEDSPLRETFYPYRASAKSPADLNYYYDKILVEREVLGQVQLPATVLRLPKVYGPGGNTDLATVYGYRDRPGWRWTHGYVENVAAAIVLAALHPAGANRVYNVGEAYTPTIAERLQTLPSSNLPTVEAKGYEFRQNIAYDTTRIRSELGYSERVSYEEGLRRTLGAAADQPRLQSA
jgi:nucleoside-diphosphate-sugar epimerase